MAHNEVVTAECLFNDERYPGKKFKKSRLGILSNKRYLIYRGYFTGVEKKKKKHNQYPNSNIIFCALL